MAGAGSENKTKKQVLRAIGTHARLRWIDMNRRQGPTPKELRDKEVKKQ